MNPIMVDGLLSIVIPNWNGKQFLQPCFDALRRQTYGQLEIIMADNASTDGSQAFVREHYPEVVIIQLPENRGFTGACNAGMEASTGEYICLLNNDTEVDPNWAQSVVDTFAQHPEVGSVASKMLLFNQRDTLHTAGDYFTTDGRPGNRGVWQRDEGQYDQEAYVFSACGGSSVYRRTMLDKIGLLDDDFFFLMEDVDLGWRAQLSGWRCLYTPKAIVYHHLSATGGGVTASFYDGRNSILLLMKNLPAALWWKYGFSILRRQASSAFQAIRAWRGEAARARLRGMVVGLRDALRFWKKRRDVQRSRTVSTAYLDSILSPPV
jgi:GT2 family glycosyltransferase